MLSKSPRLPVWNSKHNLSETIYMTDNITKRCDLVVIASNAQINGDVYLIFLSTADSGNSDILLCNEIKCISTIAHCFRIGRLDGKSLCDNGYPPDTIFQWTRQKYSSWYVQTERLYKSMAFAIELKEISSIRRVGHSLV